jgi:hypothetical protein
MDLPRPEHLVILSAHCDRGPAVAITKAVKYIYKYVYKGHDRTTMQFGKATDEIKLYLDACYVSSYKA